MTSLAFVLLSFVTAIEFNAPLTKEQRDFVSAQSPIIVQPDFAAKRDNLILFDLGTRLKDEKGEPLGTMDPGQNAKAYLTLTKESVGEIDWDFIEIGGAISLSFLLARPANLPTPRIIDSESVIMVFKKAALGVSAETGLNFSGSLILSNAHGAAMAAACDESLSSCLPPSSWAEQSYGWGLKLKDYFQEQAKGANEKGRITDIIDNRKIILSEPGTHALSPITNITKLLEKINLKDAVVYFPEGADISETKKRFAGAVFVPYRLRDKELSSVLIPKKDEIVAGPHTMNPSDMVDSWFPSVQVQLVPNLGSEFRNSEGKASGANGYWGWSVVECVKDGARYEPTSYKDGPRRAHSVALSQLCSDSLFGFFNADEIAAGALKPVRNGWMQRVIPLAPATP